MVNGVLAPAEFHKHVEGARATAPGFLKVNVPVPPPYSTDISAAWQVIERLKPKLHYIVLTFHDGGDWRCEFENCSEFGESAPHVICLAALKVVGP